MTYILWVAFGGSAVILLFFGAYVYLFRKSFEHKIQLQQEKLLAVQRSEEKYKALFDHALAGMVKFDCGTFAVLDANEAARTILLCPSIEELDACFGGAVGKHRAFIRQTLERRKIIESYEFSFGDKNGQTRWLLFSAQKEPSGDTANGVFWEITRRKQSEEKIREQAALLNQTKDSIIVISKEGDILFWNNAAVDVYGWHRTEVIGKPIQSMLFRGDHQHVCQSCMEVLEQDGEWNGEQKHWVKNGRTIIVEGTWKRIMNQFTDSVFYLIVNTDVTEKRALEKKLMYNQKMEGIALMTSGIAHDLQNILAPVSLSINLLREGLVDPSRGFIIDSIEESTGNGLKLLKNILMVGRGMKGKKEIVDLVAIVQTAIRTFSGGKPENIEIVSTMTLDACSIWGEESLLNQIFLNLFQNAKDAMPDGGRLTISVSQRNDGELEEEFELEHNEEGYAVIDVADTGCGIAAEYREKIFEPFYTTKEGVGGTGLGLPIVKDLVKSHGGAIGVKSEEGCGTTFTIIVPKR